MEITAEQKIKINMIEELTDDWFTGRTRESAAEYIERYESLIEEYSDFVSYLDY